ncbi:MAG: succinylglutamate-semialdehyde dehydrogenase [Leptospiraceae bacterium]|nr:succinylglutamate-semialdehyde dehydrogenase [Leptospiraceae bacterium]
MTFSEYIDGRWREGQGDAAVSRDKAHGTEIWAGHWSTPVAVDQAVTAARRAFNDWSRRSLESRLEFLERYTAILQRDQDKRALDLARETGKPLWECRQELGAMIAKLAVSLESYQARTGFSAFELPDSNARLHFKAHGVMVVIGPFNMPGHLPNGHIIPALLAGNTVVFKPAELTPWAGIWLCQALEEAGLPPGVLNLVPGERAVGEALVQHPDINAVLFTGSYATGRAIHQALAGRLEVLCALELGGNNPLIVSSFTDLDTAVITVLESAFVSAGQRCTCARRLILPEFELADAFLERLLERTRALQCGFYTDDPEPYLGPLISTPAARLALAAQEHLERVGGQILLPLTLERGHPALLRPGIIDVSTAAPVPDEEVFAPLLQIIRVPDFAAALAVANQTRFGLAAGLLSTDPAEFALFRQRANAGVVNWNRKLTGASSKLPFGGVGHSGNHWPAGAFAADYCAWPMSCLEAADLQQPAALPPGLGPWP